MLMWPIWSLDSKIKLNNGINVFFACCYNFMKINVKVLEFGMVKTGCGQSYDETLKLTVSEAWADGINWFFACWCRFTKIKSWSIFFCLSIVKNGCGQSYCFFFACWYNFKKAKSWYNDFWLGLVKDGSGLLVHSAASRCILVPFECYGCQKKNRQKIYNTFSIYISRKN